MTQTQQSLAVVVRVFNTNHEAEMAGQLLKAQGIENLVQVVSPVGNFTGYKTLAVLPNNVWGVYVKTNQAEQAKEILSSVLGEDSPKKPEVNFKKGRQAFIIFLAIFFGLLALTILFAVTV